jgi:hypothetical protein
MSFVESWKGGDFFLKTCEGVVNPCRYNSRTFVNPGVLNIVELKV